MSTNFSKQSTEPRLVEPGDGTKKPIPQSIGPYPVETLLSEGGMSLLYLGRHANNKPIAIKVLSPRCMKHPEMVDLFLKEARIIALSDHPNIVKLYGQGEWEKGLYIAMEFIQGISLHQFIVQNSLSVRRSLELVLQVAHALLHLHSHGIIHRDLKPENILMTETGNVKVIDFGISQITFEEVKPAKVGTVIGTPNYMSPEQLNNPRHVDPRCDIYSLGIIAYELLIGKLSQGDLQLSFIPNNLRGIIENATAKNPKDRYADVVPFITDISSALQSLSKKNTDDVNDMLQQVSAVEDIFLPHTPPMWRDLEVGIGRLESVPLMHFYYDFFHLSSDVYVIVMAELSDPSVEAMVHLGMLRGMVKALVQDQQGAAFDPISFVTTLNTIICNDPGHRHFALNVIALDPTKDRFELVMAGFRSAFNLSPEAVTPHIFHSDNPLLGQDPHATFASVKDNWDPGSIILLHSFDVAFGEQIADVEETIYRELANHFQYPPKTQARKVHDALATDRKDTNAVISLLRKM